MTFQTRQMALIAVCLIVSAVMGCGKSDSVLRSEIVGKWRVTDKEGNILDFDFQPGGVLKVDFKKGRPTFDDSLSSFFGFHTKGGTWKIKGGKLTLSGMLNSGKLLSASIDQIDNGQLEIDGDVLQRVQ